MPEFVLPQSSPPTCGVDDSGRTVAATCPEHANTRNSARDERVGVIVLPDEWDGPWVRTDGTAEVIDSPRSVEPLVYNAISRRSGRRESYRPP